MGYPQGLKSFFRRSNLLQPNLQILDAGCGTGIVSLALYQALSERGMTPRILQGFDLTPAMINLFRSRLGKLAADVIEVHQADVLQPETLPETWNNYDLIVTAAMLEYVPRERLPEALAGLASRLHKNGSLVLFMTRDNILMRLLIGRWWESNLYTAADLQGALQKAGFNEIRFERFPLVFSHLNLWGHIVEARV